MGKLSGTGIFRVEAVQGSPLSVRSHTGFWMGCSLFRLLSLWSVALQAVLYARYALTFCLLALSLSSAPPPWPHISVTPKHLVIPGAGQTSPSLGLCRRPPSVEDDLPRLHVISSVSFSSASAQNCFLPYVIKICCFTITVDILKYVYLC